MQEMYELKLGLIRECGVHLLTIEISPSYTNWMYHVEPVILG